MITKKDFDQMKALLSSTKKILCIGAKNAYKDYIYPYCINQKLLPFPYAIYDFEPRKHSSNINGIPILEIKELCKEDPYTSLIVIAEEDYPFYKALGSLYNELIAYYFPILPCTALEAYFYALNHYDEINEVSNLLYDSQSKQLYIKYWLSRIYGIVYNPLLYSKKPYFGNDIITNLYDNDVIVSGGTYNGKHIDRALKMNSKITAYLFEPNKKYYQYLSETYKSHDNIKVFNYALYNKETQLPFDLSDELGAQIVNEHSKYDYWIQTVRLDTMDIGKVSLIELDIEGSEIQALNGMRNTILKYHPKLAICVYHKISDYIEIPKLVLNYNSHYKLYFRQHSCYYEESVLYAIH